MATPTEITKRKRPGRLLTPRDAAEYLGLPQNTLAQWRSQRKGPEFFKLGGYLVRYAEEDLNTWLEAQRVKVTDSRSSGD